MGNDLAKIVSEEKLIELQQLSGGNNDLLKKLLEKYIANYENYASQIRDGLANGDNEKVRFGVHTLKGSSLSIGLNKISELLISMNDNAKKDNMATMEEDLGKLEELMAELRTFFNSGDF